METIVLLQIFALILIVDGKFMRGGWDTYTYLNNSKRLHHPHHHHNKHRTSVRVGRERMMLRENQLMSYDVIEYKPLAEVLSKIPVDCAVSPMGQNWLEETKRSIVNEPLIIPDSGEFISLDELAQHASNVSMHFSTFQLPQGSFANRRRAIVGNEIENFGKLANSAVDVGKELRNALLDMATHKAGNYLKATASDMGNSMWDMANDKVIVKIKQFLMSQLDKVLQDIKQSAFRKLADVFSALKIKVLEKIEQVGNKLLGRTAANQNPNAETRQLAGVPLAYLSPNIVPKTRRTKLGKKKDLYDPTTPVGKEMTEWMASDTNGLNHLTDQQRKNAEYIMGQIILGSQNSGNDEQKKRQKDKLTKVGVVDVANMAMDTFRKILTTTTELEELGDKIFKKVQAIDHAATDTYMKANQLAVKMDRKASKIEDLIYQALYNSETFDPSYSSHLKMLYETQTTKSDLEDLGKSVIEKTADSAIQAGEMALDRLAKATETARKHLQKLGQVMYEIADGNMDDGFLENLKFAN